MHESKSPENQYMKVILLRKKNQCINTSGSGDWARLEGDLEVGSAADHRPTLIGLLASLQRKPSLTFPKNYFALELKYKGNISNTKKIYFVCIWPVSDIATGLSSNRLNYRRFRTILTNFTRTLCGRKRTEIQRKTFRKSSFLNHFPTMMNISNRFKTFVCLPMRSTSQSFLLIRP